MQEIKKHKFMKSRLGLLNQKIWLLELARCPHVQQPEKCCDYPDVLKNADECFVLKYPLVKLK